MTACYHSPGVLAQCCSEAAWPICVLDEKAAHMVLQHPPGTIKVGQPLGRPKRAGGKAWILFKRKRGFLASWGGGLGTDYCTAGQMKQQRGK